MASGSVSTYEVHHETPPAETLLCGLSEFGLAGRPAADYLVDRLDLTERGYVTAEHQPLEAFAEAVRTQYEELADHLAEQEKRKRSPEDRMYVEHGSTLAHDAGAFWETSVQRSVGRYPAPPWA